MTAEEQFLQNFQSELKRGALVLVTLSQLRQAQHGYQLVKTLSEAGLEVEGNTLYPLLRRLEEQGLLSSSWAITEEKPRKNYVLNPKGARMLTEMLAIWQASNHTIDQLLNEE